MKSPPHSLQLQALLMEVMLLRNTGTGEYALRLEFTFADKQDNIVEPNETCINYSAVFRGRL